MELDCLLIHTPKLNDFHRLFGECIFGMYMAEGLLAIADCVYKKGYSVQILHLGIEKIDNTNFSINRYLEEIRPKIVGITLHWHFQSYDVMEIAKEIKSFDPNIFVVLGGFTASYFHEEITKEFKFVDAVIRGDGEIPMLRLVEDRFGRKNNLSDIPNLTWRNKDKTIINEITYVANSQDLDKLNFTNLKLLRKYQLYINYSKNQFFWIKGLNKNKNLNLIGNGQKIFSLPISRGCPVICSFCGGSNVSQKIINKRSYIAIRSTEAVLRSIKEVKEYNYDTIYIEYFPPDSDPFYFERLFDAIKDENIKINCILECWTLPTKRVIQKFKETFCDISRCSIYLSPESGSEKVRMLNKGYYYTNQELIENVNFIADFKIPIEIFFTFGIPFETLDDIKLTKSFQEKLRRQFKDIITIRTETIEIDPGSPIYINPEKYRVIKDRNSFKDFLKANSKQNNSESFALGYYNKNLFKDRRLDIRALDRQLQKIRCKYFCRLANFILGCLIKRSDVITRKIVYSFSRLCCNVISIYWKLWIFFKK